MYIAHLILLLWLFYNFKIWLGIYGEGLFKMGGRHFIYFLKNGIYLNGLIQLEHTKADQLFHFFTITP